MDPVITKAREMRRLRDLQLRIHRKTRHIEALAFRNSRKMRPLSDLADRVHDNTRHFGDLRFMNACKTQCSADLVFRKVREFQKCDTSDIVHSEIIAKRDTLRHLHTEMFGKYTFGDLAPRIHCKTRHSENEQLID